MNLPSKPMDLSIFFFTSKSEKNKKVRESEKNSKKSEPKHRHKIKNTRQEGILKLRVKIDGKICVYSLANLCEQKIKWSDWTDGRHKTDFELNLKIDKVKSDFKTLNTLMTVAGIEVTSDNIVHTYRTLNLKMLEPTYDNLLSIDIIKDRSKSKYKPVLIDLINEHLLYLRTFLKKETVDCYKCASVTLAEYFGKNKVVLAEDFEREDFLKFLDYLATERGLMRTSIKCNYFNVIKRVYFHYIERGIIPENKILLVKYKAKSEQDLRSIALEQIKQLHNLQVHTHIYRRRRYLNFAKDSYEFSCYTALHMVEKININSSHLFFIDNAYWLINKRSKTKKFFYVKLHPVAVSLIYKYSLKVLSEMPVQVAESLSLFDVLKIGLDNFPRLDCDRMNYYLIKLSEMLGFELHTSKIARKTFTNDSINRRKLQPNVIAKTMGIKENMISYYGEVNIKTISDAYNFDDAA